MPRLEDPPPLQNRLLDSVEFAKAHPGEWVLARSYNTSNVARASGSRLKQRVDGPLETRCRRENLYIRWVS
jgi:hypothetical protein